MVPVERSGMGAKNIGYAIVGVIAAIAIAVVAWKAYQFAQQPLPSFALSSAGLQLPSLPSSGGLGNTPTLPNLGCHLQNVNCKVEQYFKSIQNQPTTGYATFPTKYCNFGFPAPNLPIPPRVTRQQQSFNSGYTQQCLLICPLTGGYVNQNCICPVYGVSQQASSFFSGAPPGCPLGYGGSCYIPYCCGPQSPQTIQGGCYFGGCSGLCFGCFGIGGCQSYASFPVCTYSGQCCYNF